MTTPISDPQEETATTPSTNMTPFSSPSEAWLPLAQSSFGIGPGSVLRPGLARLLVSCRLERRASVKRFPTFNSAESVYKEFKVLADLDREHFIILGLDRQNRCIAVYVASIGTMTEAMVSPREIYRMAILSASVSLVGIHNHCSGNPRLSNQDIEVGKRLSRVGEEIGITFIDMIVIGSEGFDSMNERGLFR